MLIGEFSKWESISYLVRACCETDDDMIARSRLAVDNWLGSFNRDFSTPTAEQVAKLKEALETCGASLTEATREQLQFILRAH